MKTYKSMFVLFIVGIFSVHGLQAGEQNDELLTRRFAFLVGANNGGENRVTLRYAVDDAIAIQKVLEEMGGILPGDSRFLPDPDRDTFFKAMEILSEDVNKSKKKFRRVELIFYYSGHSDEENLFLGSDRISYQEFKDLITSIQADVRIGILDSCASGALTLPKGVIKKPPFLLDNAYDMKGYAFITSSSATEAAQESSRLKRSFFTHNLISGMRGAADRNQDGRITLNEAYQFAFDGTLNQTEKTMAGPQHPSYHIEMSGHGDVVITEIWKSTAVLVLKENIAGRIYIHNQENVLVVELNKMLGREISIGLDAGSYRIININEGRIWETKIGLENGKSSDLFQEEFNQTDKIPTQLRGVLPEPIPSPKINGFKKWRLEIFGGFSRIDPKDLNLRASFDNMYSTFYGEDYIQYLAARGEILSFNKSNEGGEAQSLRHSVPAGIRLRYGLTNWLDLSFGITYITGTKESSFKNSFEIIDSSSSTLFYTDEFNIFKLSAKAIIPSVGVHLSKRISKFSRIEVSLAGGPVFGECSYYIDWKLEDPLGKPFGDYGSLEDGYLEEKGKGRGVSLKTAIKLDYDFAKNYGVFLEGGYAYQTVSEISGPGIRSYTSHRESWEGEWAIKKDVKVEPWGIAHFLWPSNGWEYFPGTWWRTRDFELDLSGFQVKAGLYFRF